MASADAFTLSARVPHKTADEFKKVADSLGMTPNALIKDMVERAVNGKPAVGSGVQEDPEAAKQQINESKIHTPRMYKVALDLVDDLMAEKYPESEIENALKRIRRELL